MAASDVVYAFKKLVLIRRGVTKSKYFEYSNSTVLSHKVTESTLALLQHRFAVQTIAIHIIRTYTYLILIFLN